MPVFASTTTSGYSDPLKAYSIKALEQRQRDMLQQQTQQPQAFTPENTQTPLQGLAQVANVGVDAMRQRRTDDAVAAQKDELSKLIAGTPAGQDPSPQVQARMAVIAPDIYKGLQEAMIARRAQEAGFTHADKAAAEAARIAREAKIDEEQRIANRPTSDAAKIMQDVQAGKLTPAQGEALVKKLTSGPVSEQKFVKDLQEQSVAGQSLLASLDTAMALTKHPKGIHAGGGAGFVQGIGEMVPTRLQGISSAAGLDPETVENTQRFNQIMGEQALELLNKMKGASSDRDVKINFDIVNSPNATLKNKQDALGKLRDRIATLLELHNNTIKEAGGTVPALQTGSSGGAAAPAATGGGGGGADPMEGRTATGADGKQIIRRNGKWEPM